ncbi:MAG TPA: flagellar filament capping protein FliD, partial [Gemmataceae bacterium]|nr:flagellar filament capping protein FliD [Gemmataceae bacterium]
LQGLANAINNSGAGVAATVVNDGSGSTTQPYRLLLSANQAGADNAITITNSLAADGSAARKPVFDATYINQAVLGTGYTGTSVPTVNAGSGGYTGTSNNTYTFTVVNGGTVGTDNGITLSYADSTGQNTGTITLNSSDVNQLKTVSQGLQVQFGSGTLVAGQTFSVDAFVPVVQAATSASVTLGSGGGALTVQSDSNQLSNLINGVTLNLTAADPSKTLSLTVSSDPSKATTAVQDLVTAYNDVMQTIDNYVSYDPQSGTAGTLLGNGEILQIQGQVRSIFNNAVKGANPLLSTFSALGITTNQDGTISLDTSKLNSVLSGQVAGVSLADVRNLFTLSGSSDNPAINFVTAGDKTATGPVQVNITQAATQGTMMAANALASSIVIDNSNNTLTMQVDGHTSSTITLASGTYTPTTLTAELQSEINANSELAGRQVSVGLNANRLVVTSSSFGSSSHVGVGTGTALSVLGFAGNEGGSGTDVAGSFIVNGVTETATGDGQFLIGNSGNTHTAGLEVRAAVTAAQLGSGISGTVTVTRGIGSALDQALNGMLDPITGRFQSIDQNLQQSYDTLQQEVSAQQTAINSHRQQLVAQFTQMESTLAQLQSASSTLSTSLLSLYTLNNGKNSTSSSG